VLVAVGLSVAERLRRVARPHDGILGFVPGTAGMHDVDDYPEARQLPGLVVYRYDSPLFFANAEDFRTRALGAVQSAAALTRRGVVVAMARVTQDRGDSLQATGLDDRVGAELIFPTLPTAVQAFDAWRTARDARPGRRRSGAAPGAGAGPRAFPCSRSAGMLTRDHRAPGQGTRHATVRGAAPHRGTRPRP
jgi:SulP family sulfate permease